MAETFESHRRRRAPRARVSLRAAWGWFLGVVLVTTLAGCGANTKAIATFAPTEMCAGPLEACAATGALRPFSRRGGEVRGLVRAGGEEVVTLAMPAPRAEWVDLEGANVALRLALLRADGQAEPIVAAHGVARLVALPAAVGDGDRMLVEVTRVPPAPWIGVTPIRFGAHDDLGARRLAASAAMIAIVGWLLLAAATTLADGVVGHDRRAALGLFALTTVIAVRDTIFLRTVLEGWALFAPELSLRIEYATVGFGSMAAVFFCREVTKGEARVASLGRPIRAEVVLAALSGVLAFVWPTTAALRVAQIAGLGAMIAVSVMLAFAWRTIERREFLALVAGFGAVIVGAAIDIADNLRNVPLFLGTGFVIVATAFMVFAHGLVLAFRAAATHARAERLAVDVREASEAVIREHERTNESLRRLDRMKDEFLANTSHELRTPLNGILGLIEATLEGAQGAVSAGIARNLELVHGSARRLAALVNDILDFSKLKQHEVTLRLGAAELRVLTDLVLRSLEPLARDKGLTLVNAVDETLRAEADGDRVQQILTNLVGNAVKFTERGAVRVESHVEGERVVLTVRDTGIGIPASAFERIFDSFEQVDGSTERNFGGTGLGLAITKKLVELHGGAVRVASEVGVGSAFAFDLAAVRSREDAPVASPVADPAPAAHLEPMSNGTPAPGSQILSSGVRAPSLPPSMKFRAPGLRVLVVDDEPVNREVLAQHLAHQGYEVLLARDGDEALALLDAPVHPDLLVLDVMMPKRSGYEVLERIRSDDRHAQTPVILLTARALPADLARGFELGANDYLTKPVSLVELEARVGHQARILAAQRAIAAHADELEATVARRTEELHVALARVTSMHEALKVKDADRTRDLQEARRFQELTVPRAQTVGAFGVASAFWPAADVGGDFVDVRAMGDRWLRVFLADATGHGVQAALRAMVVKTMYDSACTVESTPGGVLHDLNCALVEAYPDLEAKVDAACVDLREVDGGWHVVAAQAGGVAVGIATPLALDELLCTGLPLGVGAEAIYAPVSRALPEGARVVVLSDGILDQQDAAGQLFEWEGLASAFVSPTATRDLEGALVALRTAWGAHRGDVPQDDDATLVVVEPTRSP